MQLIHIKLTVIFGSNYRNNDISHQVNQRHITTVRKLILCLQERDENNFLQVEI